VPFEVASRATRLLTRVHPFLLHVFMLKSVVNVVAILIKEQRHIILKSVDMF